jgi:ferredoxin
MSIYKSRSRNAVSIDPYLCYDISPAPDTAAVPPTAKYPYIDKALFVVDPSRIHVHAVEQTFNRLKLRISGVDHRALNCIRQAFSHLPCMAITNVQVMCNDTLSAHEVVRECIQAQALDLDAKDYDYPMGDPKRENSGKPDRVHVFVAERAYEEPISLEASETFPFRSVTTEAIRQFLPAIQYQSPETMQPTREDATVDSDSSCSTSSSTMDWMKDEKWDEQSMSRPIVYRREGELPVELFHFRPPQNFLPTRPVHQVCMNLDHSRLYAFGTAVKGSAHTNGSHKLFAVVSKCTFHTIYRMHTLNKHQRERILTDRTTNSKAHPSFLQHVPNVPYRNDEREVVLDTGSNYEHYLEAEERREQQRSPYTCIPPATLIASRCDQGVFDIEEAYAPSPRLRVANAEACNGCGACVQSDTSGTLYYEPHPENQWWFEMETRGPYSAACIWLRTLNWCADMEYSAWEKQLLLNPQPMHAPNPEYSITQPGFTHLLGPSPYLSAHTQIKALRVRGTQPPLRSSTKQSDTIPRHFMFPI